MSATGKGAAGIDTAARAMARAAYQDRPASTPDDDGAPAGSPTPPAVEAHPRPLSEDVPQPPTAAGGPDRA